MLHLFASYLPHILGSSIPSPSDSALQLLSKFGGQGRLLIPFSFSLLPPVSPCVFFTILSSLFIHFVYAATIDVCIVHAYGKHFSFRFICHIPFFIFIHATFLFFFFSFFACFSLLLAAFQKTMIALSYLSISKNHQRVV